MVGYFFRIGPFLETGMGSVPLTHSEIESWQNNSGVELTSWEAEMIRKLSVDYLSESQKAIRPDCPAPWRGAELSRKFIAGDMKSTIRGLTEL